VILSLSCAGTLASRTTPAPASADRSVARSSEPASTGAMRTKPRTRPACRAPTTSEPFLITLAGPCSAASSSTPVSNPNPAPQRGHGAAAPRGARGGRPGQPARPPAHQRGAAGAGGGGREPRTRSTQQQHPGWKCGDHRRSDDGGEAPDLDDEQHAEEEG